jgi:hypothetical protein
MRKTLISFSIARQLLQPCHVNNEFAIAGHGGAGFASMHELGAGLLHHCCPGLAQRATERLSRNLGDQRFY